MSTGTKIDYYRLLGVSPEATAEEIRAAYRDKVRLHHPDMAAGKGDRIRRAATEMTARLNEAYHCLSDPHRRAAYDAARKADAAAAHTSPDLLVVSPRSLHCEVTPGNKILLTLNVQAPNPPGRKDFQVSIAEPLVVTGFTVTPRTAQISTLKVRVDTSRLNTRHSYHTPVHVAWGKLTGAATLMISTTGQKRSGTTTPSRPEPTSFSHGRWTRPPERRVRDVATISLGGIVAPLIVLAWMLGSFPAAPPVYPAFVASVCAGVVVSTVWFLSSSRLLRRPHRLSRAGVTWGRLMRWSGWLLIGSCALVLGIPAVSGFLTVAAIIASPVLGLVVIAIISSLFDS